MNKQYFGTLPTGENVHLYTLENSRARLTLTDFGATVVSLYVFGTDVVGGFDTLESYLADDSHQGGTIGRVANRIGGARFEMDGKIYTLPDNDGGNCLHGGRGFDRRLWQVSEHNDTRLIFTYTSGDGEEGFPSEVSVTLTYTLTGASLRIDYCAIPKGKTPIALTNHTYFNLDGLGGTVLNHKIKIYADSYTEVDASLIPTGNRPPVDGTVFDLRTPKRIGDALTEGFTGYDHNFILCPPLYGDFQTKPVFMAAEVWGKKIKMTVYTNQPCLQFYIGNFLGYGPDFKGGIKQVKHGALCLETQTEPNCINHGIGFYDRGTVYRHITVYCFDKTTEEKA